MPPSNHLCSASTTLRHHPSVAPLVVPAGRYWLAFVPDRLFKDSSIANCHVWNAHTTLVGCEMVSHVGNRSGSFL